MSQFTEPMTYTEFLAYRDSEMRGVRQLDETGQLLPEDGDDVISKPDAFVPNVTIYRDGTYVSYYIASYSVPDDSHVYYSGLYEPIGLYNGHINGGYQPYTPEIPEFITSFTISPVEFIIEQNNSSLPSYTITYHRIEFTVDMSLAMPVWDASFNVDLPTGESAEVIGTVPVHFWFSGPDWNNDYNVSRTYTQGIAEVVFLAEGFCNSDEILNDIWKKQVEINQIRDYKQYALDRVVIFGEAYLNNTAALALQATISALGVVAETVAATVSAAAAIATSAYISLIGILNSPSYSDAAKKSVEELLKLNFDVIFELVKEGTPEALSKLEGFVSGAYAIASDAFKALGVVLDFSTTFSLRTEFLGQIAAAISDVARLNKEIVVLQDELQDLRDDYAACLQEESSALAVIYDPAALTDLPQILDLPQGPQSVEAVLAQLDGDILRGFTEDDSLLLRNLLLDPSQVTVLQGSAILVIDSDLDGSAEGIIRLEGDFEGAELVLTAEGADTRVTFDFTTPAPQPTSENDTLVGTTADETIDGLAGNDLIVNAGGGRDRFEGGPGIDTLRTDVTGLAAEERLLLDMPNGIHGREGTELGRDTISGIENFELYGDWDAQLIGDANDNLLISGSGDDLLSGGDGNDILMAGAGNDTLTDGPGNDVLDGGPGIDLFERDYEGLYTLSPVIDLMSGLILAEGRNGPSEVLLEVENTTTRGAHHHEVNGSAVANRLETGPGNDTITGGGGADSLFGNAGFDVLIGGTHGLFHVGQSAQVYRLYDTVFGREPDGGGHHTWTLALLGGTTLAQAAAAFVGSQEFQATYGNATNAEFVTLLYLNVLNRTPSDTDRDFWVARLERAENPWSRTDVVLHFSEGPEHVAKTAVAQDLYDETRDITNWGDEVYRLYGAIFNRDPDAGGFNTWTGALASGASTLTEVTGNFMASPEFQATYGNTTNAQFVTLLYQNVLNRTPSQAEIDYWSGRIDGGEDRARVVLFFAESPENVGNTRAPMVAWMQGRFPDDVLDPGAGDAVVSGGAYADTFVFTRDGQASEVIVTDVEAWDMLDFSGFGLSQAQVLGSLAQVGEDVVFNAGAETVVFKDTQLAAITQDMILV